MNVYCDPEGCQTLLLKESEPLLSSLGALTNSDLACNRNYQFTANSDFMLVLLLTVDYQRRSQRKPAISCTSQLSKANFT